LQTGAEARKLTACGFDRPNGLRKIPEMGFTTRGATLKMEKLPHGSAHVVASGNCFDRDPSAVGAWCPDCGFALSQLKPVCGPDGLRRLSVRAAHNSPRWSATMASEDRVPMTREGYERLKADLDRMANTEMMDVARRIASARELGDLSENAEYHAAREDQGILQARIDALKDKLSRAIFIDKSTMPTGTVVFGSRVKVKDIELDEEETFVLVGPGDEDYSQNKILTSSPIGQGLLGKKIGDKAEIAVPMGTLKFQVVEISFEG
jgi:transcription elongation factor GreA